MSDRERKLLIFLGAAIFLVGTIFGYSWVATKRQEVQKEITRSEGILNEAELFERQQASVAKEMDWLVEHQREPVEAELVPSKLVEFAVAQATNSGLTIKNRKILPDDESGLHYTRARVELKLTGAESSLYRWFHRIHDPLQFRAVTAIRLSPNREDDTKIDATVVVEEWFVPLAADNATASLENE